MTYIVLYTSWTGQRLWEEVDVSLKAAVTEHVCKVAVANHLSINAIIETSKKVARNGETAVAEKFYKLHKEE